MLNKRLLILIIGICLVLLVSTSALAAPLMQGSASEKSEVLWQLTETVVIDPGTTVKISEGVLTTGYTVEAVAKASSDQAPVQDGTFRLTMTVFSPDDDMPGQKAGRWYVRGLWTVVDSAAKSTDVNRRHSPDAVRGLLSTELSFNPATTKSAFAADFLMPMSLNKGRWAKGEGTFFFDEQMEGSAKMAVESRPDVMKKVRED
jgi:hypothetical protein